MKPDALPLPALLSAVFVAFTVEADNAFEQQLPHRTTSFGAGAERGAVWLTSLAMWFNCVRGLSDGGPQTVTELERRVRMGTNLDGMRRWGYITIDGTGRVPRRPGGAGKPHARPGSVLALTDRGRAADAVWRPLPGRSRRGGATVSALPRSSGCGRGWCRSRDRSRRRCRTSCRSLWATTSPRNRLPRDPAERAQDRELPLVSLLSRVLLRFELDCDHGERVWLAVWSDLIRVLDPSDAVAVRDLPALTGVSKEALSVMTGRLEKAGVVVLEPRPAPARGKQLRLTPDRGVRARAAVPRRIERTVHAWEQTYGRTAVAELHAALRAVAGDGTRDGSPLFAGLEPPADGWRAQLPPPRLLPWHPLVWHRGGYPDGS